MMKHVTPVMLREEEVEGGSKEVNARKRSVCPPQ